MMASLMPFWKAKPKDSFRLYDLELVSRCGQPVAESLFTWPFPLRFWAGLPPPPAIAVTPPALVPFKCHLKAFIFLLPLPLNLQRHWLLLSISNPWRLFPRWQLFEVFGDIVVWGKLGEWGKCYHQNSMAFKSSLVPVRWGILWPSWEYFILTH